MELKDLTDLQPYGVCSKPFGNPRNGIESRRCSTSITSQRSFQFRIREMELKARISEVPARDAEGLLQNPKNGIERYTRTMSSTTETL